MTRDAILETIRSKPEVSVLIIGGGINGIGTFRDLALQGVDVLLVDRGDFCSGASAASSHMAHGGLRYLENGEFRLVKEALTERNRLMQNAPHYVKPLPTTIPIFHWFSGMLNAPLKFLGLLDKPSNRGAVVIKMGLTLYDWFTRGQQTLPRHRFTSREESLRRRPRLNPDIIATATYYDGLLPYPERIALEVLLDGEAASPHARAASYMKAVNAGTETVTLEDTLTGEQYEVKPKIVVNASGPWIDFTNAALQRGSTFIGGTKGSHLVVDHPDLYEATQGHEMFFENSDGRICLFFPLLDRVMVGTTDIPIDDPDQAECTDEEIDYMLSMIKLVFPDIEVRHEHIVFHFSGVRPLPASDASTPGQISRDHSIKTIEAGERGTYPILSLVGGKWTSFRAFSEQVTDDVLARLGQSRRTDTRTLAIGGGKGYPQDIQRWINEQQLRTGLDRERLETLFERYGTRALNIIEAGGVDETLQYLPDFTPGEIAFIARNEKVVHLDDVVLRRSLLAMMGKINIYSLEEVARIVAEALDWTAEQTRTEVERTADILRRNHGVQIAG